MKPAMEPQALFADLLLFSLDQQESNRVNLCRSAEKGGSYSSARTRFAIDD